MTIWGNTIVKNEDKFIWFALMSVIDFLDKILIWDTGSSDNTVEIIKDIQKKYPKKILFRQYKEVNREGLTRARQEMLEQTKSDWIFLLDGDEVWWTKSIKNVRQVIEQKGDQLDFLINPTYNLIGDVHHYQEEEAGQYKIAGYKGHLNIRAINRKIPGLHLAFPYPNEAFLDSEERYIQERDPKRILFLEAPYLHLSHLQRSSSLRSEKGVIDRLKKRKYELGIPFPKDFKFPEVFYDNFPPNVPSPWQKRTLMFKLVAGLQTPLKKVRRRILK